MQELTIDLQNYAPDAPVFRRTAVRGIICRDGKYLLIHSKYGDYKFPGGGMEQGESLTDTLLREVREETGYEVMPASIREFLLVHERRKGAKDDLLLMDSYYYFCDVSDTAGARNLDAYEQEYDYQTVWMTLEDAIAASSDAAGNLADVPWVQREMMVMQELLKQNGTMDPIWQKMFDAAKAVQHARTISDYVTGGGVAAAILSKSGRIYTGVCIDTCSTLGICAERNAIFAMIMAGEQEIDKVLAIMPDGKSGAPCGACRELMVQLMPDAYRDIEIMMNMQTGRTVTLGELTPEWWIGK